MGERPEAPADLDDAAKREWLRYWSMAVVVNPDASDELIRQYANGQLSYWESTGRKTPSLLGADYDGG